MKDAFSSYSTQGGDSGDVTSYVKCLVLKGLLVRNSLKKAYEVLASMSMSKAFHSKEDKLFVGFRYPISLHPDR